MNVDIVYSKIAKKDKSSLGPNQISRLENILSELYLNPYKSNWPLNYHWEKLDKTWKGNPAYSIRLGGTDRLVYSIDNKTKELIIISLISLKGHYQGKFKSRHAYADLERTLRSVRAMCTTKDQMIAFNQLMNSLKFRVSR